MCFASRKEIEHFHINKGESQDSTLQKYSYEIEVPFDGLTKFKAVTVKTIYRKQEKVFEIVSDRKNHEHKDRSNVGRFIQLLAIKYKYDILCGLDPDNAGFLHIDEIKNLIEANCIKIPAGIYYSLTRIQREAYKGNRADTKFLLKFLFDINQLFNLINYYGIVGDGPSYPNINTLFYLNIPPDNIHITGIPKTISTEHLKKKLQKIFPKRCLLNEPQWKAARDKLDEHYHINRSNMSLAEALKRAKDKSGHNDSPLKSKKFKYFSNMKDILYLEDKAEWFRKSGPIATDFRAGYVYERKQLGELSDLISENRISILEGSGGTGKSVLVRNYAYNQFEKQDVCPIYYYSFKGSPPISDSHEFYEILNSIQGLIIIEDVHLADGEILMMFNNLRMEPNLHILFTTRISSQKNNQVNYEGQCETSLDLFPSMSIHMTDSEVDGIIDSYMSSKEDFIFTASHKRSIKKISENNLWLLSYAIMGCYNKNGICEPELWIREEVKSDFTKLERSMCNTKILLALSPLYKNEVLTAHAFLKDKFSFSYNDIKILLDRHEIVKVTENRKVYYGLPHSALAELYWDFRDESMTDFLENLNKTQFEKNEYLNFIYNYATYRLKNGSGVANGLSAILKMDYPNRTLMLQRLDIERKTMQTLMSETNIESFFDWIRSYGFYFSKNPTDNIWAEVIIPAFWGKGKDESYKFTHETIREIRDMCGVPEKRKKLIDTVTNLPPKQSLNPKNMREILIILSYIDKDIMNIFWDSIDHISFKDKLMFLELYNICESVTFLFWIGREYGEHIWGLIDKIILKERLNDIVDDVLVAKAIGTFRIYLPDEIACDFMSMFDIDEIISRISALNDGFCRNYYIAMFSLFDENYKERLEKIFDIDSFVRHMPNANLVELSICIKYLFNTYQKYKSKLYELNYKLLANKFDQEIYLDGVLRTIESIYTANHEAGKKLCRELNIDRISVKLKQDRLQYKTKEQFVEFIHHIDSSIGKRLLKKINMQH